MGGDRTRLSDGRDSGGRSPDRGSRFCALVLCGACGGWACDCDHGWVLALAEQRVRLVLGVWGLMSAAADLLAEKRSRTPWGLFAVRGDRHKKDALVPLGQQGSGSRQGQSVLVGIARAQEAPIWSVHLGFRTSKGRRTGTQETSTYYTRNGGLVQLPGQRGQEIVLAAVAESGEGRKKPRMG